MVVFCQTNTADEIPISDCSCDVGASGRLSLNGRLLEPLALKPELAAQLAAQPDLPVTLRADGAAEATEVVAVMETLRDAGVRHLQLFAQASPSAPGTAEP